MHWALADIQPFGGFNMSGADSKAGGRDYLLLFLQRKGVSQKIRAGLAGRGLHRLADPLRGTGPRS